MLYRLYNEIGFSVCHQLPSRSIFIDGVKMPVDARMTGMFVGFFLTFVFLLFLYSKASRVPPKHIIFLGVTSIALLAFDGLSSYAGLRETNNILRLLSGLPVGVFMALMLQSAYNETKTQATEQRVLASPNHQLILLFMISAAFAVIAARFSLLKYLLPLIIIAGIVVSFMMLNLTALNMILNKKSYNWLLGIGLVSLELSVTYKLHSLALPYINML